MSEEESSVLFSLKELMTIEEDRIKTEETDRQAAAAEAERARLEAERLAREAEEARKAAEEQRRLQEEQRVREEAARLEAIQQGEIAKVKQEAQSRAQMEAMTAQQEHERKLAALTQDKTKKNLRNALIGGGLLVLIVGGIAGYFVYQGKVESDRALAAQQAEASRIKVEKDRKEKELMQMLTEIKELQRQKDAAAGDTAKLHELERQLKAKEDEAAKLGGKRGGGRRPPGGGKAGPKPDRPEVRTRRSPVQRYLAQRHLAQRYLE